MQRLSPVNIGRAFKEMGFRGERLKGVRGYWALERSAEEMFTPRQVALIVEYLGEPQKNAVLRLFSTLSSTCVHLTLL